MRLNRLMQWAFLGCLTVSLVGMPTLPIFAQVQSVLPQEAAKAVYQRLPDLPLENQYQRVDGDKKAEPSTLISRFVQYHTGTKGRSPMFRFDWKITLADYLGVNEYLDDNNYPGKIFLKTSAMEGDRAAIRKLTLTQRNALVQALVDVYGGGRKQSTTPTSKPAPTKNKPKPAPVQGPGSADLLRIPAPTGRAQDLLPR